MDLRRSSIQTQRDVVAWTTRIVRGVQRLRRRSTTEATLSERELKIRLDTAHFDPFFYWRWMAPIEEPIYLTQSRVKELITYRSAAYAFCSGGEMLKLDVSEDGLRVFVVWEVRLVVYPLEDASSPTNGSPAGTPGNFRPSSSLSSLSSNLSASSPRPFAQLQRQSSLPSHPNAIPAHINHAAINASSKTFYFSIKTEGIFYAKLNAIEHGLESPRDCSLIASSPRKDCSLIKPLVTRLTHPNLLSFNGLTVDAGKCLLFCCCEEGVTVWSTYPHSPVLLLTIQMPLFAAINQAVNRPCIPYKCALLPDPYCNAKASLVVADKISSELVTFSLQYYTPILPGPAMSAAVVKTQSLALPGDRIGYVQHPQGLCFDGNGNLLIADNGNQRIQFFALQEDPSRPQSRLFSPDNDGCLNLRADDAISVRLGLFEQLKSVTPMRTSSYQQGQMIILAGLGKSFGTTSGGKIISIRCPLGNGTTANTTTSATNILVNNGNTRRISTALPNTLTK